MTRGASIRARLRKPVLLRAPALAAVAASLLAAGCGSVAWHATPAVPGECVLTAPVQAEPFAAAVKGTTQAIEGAVPRFEMFGGGALLAIGDKSGGTDGAGTLVPWSAMFDQGFGFDVQIALRRPPRAALSLATGDTFVLLRGTMETYTGKRYGAGWTPGSLTVMGGWVEGRTLLSALDAAASLRPYLQYGGGVMRYSEVTVAGTTPTAFWDATIALGWRTAVGLELRKGKLGLYVEGGIQVVGPPDVSTDAWVQANTARMVARTAQDLVTYPIRFGLMIGF